jgi:predicted TIM-barrel fold metal-dependent hydrolase
MVDTYQPNDKALSFTHRVHAPISAELEKRGIPVALHVAANGDYQPVSPSFRNNGKAEDAVGGVAPIGARGLPAIGSSTQILLAAMVFDGIFERHPNLKVISMEHGATWLPSRLRQLDLLPAC